MKVLYLTKYFPPEHGGIETLAKNICDYFYKKKIYLEVCSFSKNKTYTTYKNKYKLNFFKSDIEVFSTPFSLKMFKYVSRKSKEVDYIHIHTPNPWPTFFLTLIKTNKIIVSWGSDIISQKKLKIFFKFLQNLLLKKAKKIICLSNKYLNTSEDLKHFRNKAIIIPPLFTLSITESK